MFDNIDGNFTVNGRQWQYISNNDNSGALFDGEPFPTRGVLDLIGREGVNRIDAILKGMKRVKEIIYGEDSIKIAFGWHQYVASIPAQQKNRTLPHIFENNPIIVCNASIGFSLDLTPPDDYIKQESFDDDVFSEILSKEIQMYRDYVIHLISEVNPEMQKKVLSLQEFEKIKNGDKETIGKIQDKSLQDNLEFLL